MYSLPIKSIAGIPVIVNIVPKGNFRVRPAYSMSKPKSIAIHNTGNADKGADAEVHNRLLHNQAKLGNQARYASYHFVVDEHSIYQNIPLDESAWHTGDGSGVNSGNRTAIGIEICENVDGDYAKAEANAVHLVAYLLKSFKLSINEVKPHQAYSGKYCPHIILSRKGGFQTFKNEVMGYQAGNTVKLQDKGNSVSPNASNVDRVDDSVIGKRVESIYKGKEGLNFYSKASFDAKYKVGVIGYGMGFPSIVEKLKIGGAYMYKVKNSKGVVYYVTASPTYVKVEGEAKKVSKPVSKPAKTSGIPVKGKVVVDGVKNYTYVYEKPNGKAKQVEKAHKNAVYSISGSVPDWYEVIVDGKRGYIRSKYCSKK
jgi:N-acetylmuramoyl-L-alanine amidase